MKCVLCNQDAGFLRREHERCRAAHENGVARMIDLSAATALGKRPLAGLMAELNRIASASHISADSLHGLMAQGWIAGLNSVLDERLLAGSEQAALGAYLNQFRFIPSALRSVEGGAEAMDRLRQSMILRDMVNGKMPDPQLWNDVAIPFNLMKSEALVYAFADVRYFEDKTKRERVGGSMGTSVRVMSGFYIRNSRFRSHTEEEEVTEHVDTGVLGLTTKHIYFSGERRKFRVRYDKIVAFDYYRDGLGITRDALTAKPQKFLVGSERGWFTSNLVYLLSADQG